MKSTSNEQTNNRIVGKQNLVARGRKLIVSYKYPQKSSNDRP